jgi:chromate transporter
MPTKQDKAELVYKPRKSRPWRNILDVLIVSTKLGVTSFGGPAAHIGYFHNEYVRRKQWLDDQSYADMVALCQFLPGPASSKVGIGIGTLKAGAMGGIAAWIGFTLPSVILLVCFAMVMQGSSIQGMGWIHGLKLVAAAIVAHALISMGKKLTPDLPRITIAAASACISLLWMTAVSQIAIIIGSAILGMLLFSKQEVPASKHFAMAISRRVGLACLSFYVGLLIILPLLREVIPSHSLALFDSFYRSGALVFGGGHVVLPLLEKEFVPTGFVSSEQFLAGYGAAQAVPGPLFTFASYLGAMNDGYSGAIIATAAIFLPAFLLVFGTLPFWTVLRKQPRIQAALMGINAAVVGLLLAALYNPLWTSSVHDSLDFAVVVILFTMLVYWKLPPWIVVICGAVFGMLIAN